MITACAALVTKILIMLENFWTKNVRGYKIKVMALWTTEGEGDFLGVAVATSSKVLNFECEGNEMTARRKMPNSLQFLKSGAVVRRS